MSKLKQEPSDLAGCRLIRLPNVNMNSSTIKSGKVYLEGQDEEVDDGINIGKPPVYILDRTGLFYYDSQKLEPLSISTPKDYSDIQKRFPPTVGVPAEATMSDISLIVDRTQQKFPPHPLVDAVEGLHATMSILEATPKLHETNREAVKVLKDKLAQLLVDFSNGVTHGKDSPLEGLAEQSQILIEQSEENANLMVDKTPINRFKNFVQQKDPPKSPVATDANFNKCVQNLEDQVFEVTRVSEVSASKNH